MQAMVPHARRAALAGAAAAEAAATQAGDGAELRAAPPMEVDTLLVASSKAPGNDAIEEARDLVKGALDKSEVLSPIGNGWVQVTHDDLDVSQLLDIGAAMAQNPAVQLAALDAVRGRNPELTLQKMAISASAASAAAHEPRATSLGFSQAELVQVDAESVASSFPESLSASVSDIARAEVAAEDATNRSFLFPHAAKLQAAARGKLARRLLAHRRQAASILHPADGVLLSDLPAKAQVAIALTPVVRGDDGTVEVVLKLAIRMTHQLPPAPPGAPAETRWTKGATKPEVGMETISTIALIVGLLAVVVTRNPAAAPLAAASAATVITALCAKAHMRTSCEE